MLRYRIIPTDRCVTNRISLWEKVARFFEKVKKYRFSSNGGAFFAASRNLC